MNDIRLRAELHMANLCSAAGALGPLIAPEYFVSSQVPVKPHPLQSTEHVIALQLGNAYFLLCLLGLGILNTTKDPKVVRAYIWALLIADVTHVGISSWGVGLEHATRVQRWGVVDGGNIGFTAWLFLMRCLYLLGFFGANRLPGKAVKMT